MARGGELIIDEQFVKNLIDADKAIRNISDSASDAERSMTSWISKLNSGSLTDFVRSLEETKNKYDLMIGALSKQEGFGKFTQNCKDAADEVQKLINVISQTPQFKLDLYDQQTVQRTKEIEQNARTIQEKQLRDNAIAEQKKAHVQEELNRYKLLKKEIEELEKIKREAKDVKTTSTDTELVKDAKKTYTEANRQLKAYKEEQKKLEAKYAVEIELMNKDAAMRSFSSRVKAAKDAEKAVEEEIEKEKKARLQALEQESREYQRHTERIKELERQKKSVDGDAKKAVEAEIKREKDAYLKSLVAQIKARQEYNARMEALAREQAKRDSNRRRENFNNLAITDPNKLASNAINYANRIYSDKGVLSINNMQKALSRMRDAQQNLNLNTAEGRKKYDELGQQIKRVEKDLKNATKGVGGFKSESDELGRIFSQLKTQLAAVFGLAAIKGYLQQLVNIRKEFELQKVALGAILQSKEKANQLWNQTVQLALKSPFSVKELITYTKQLSAYRIETDKLHDTTKRLADVSAGLGVDMSRLILAYGQVRAAEYLRGTELRQFTEAGIPMLEELARYFTEIEGRAISTADVFDMISKRMVDFTDVEAVIHRMTNEGGVFFQMQEKQSKTLQGELSNLQDAYHLMLNEIGETQSGTIKNLIRITRVLVDNWETIANVAVPALNSLIFGMITFRIVSAKANGTLSKFFTNLITNLKATKIYLTQGSAALQSFMPTGAASVKAGVWGAIIAAIAASVIQLISVWIEHNKALEEVNKKYNELRSNISRLHVNFINATKDLNLDEQRKALQDLIDMANDEYYMKIKIDVKEIDESEIGAIFNNIREQTIIANAFANKFATAFEEAKHWVVTDDIQEDFQQLASSFSNLANEIQSKKNTILSSFNDLANQGGTLSKRMQNALEIINTPISENETELEYTQKIIEAYKILIDERDKYLAVLSNRKMQESPLWGGKATDEFNKWKNWYENAGLGKDLWDDLFGDFDGDLKEARAEFDDFISTLVDDVKHFSKEDAEVYLTASIDKLASENEWSDFVTTVVKRWTEETFVELGVKLVRRDNEEKKKLLDWQNTYNRLFKTFKGFQEIKDPLTTQIKTAERLNSLYDNLSDEIERIKKAGGDATTMGKGAYSNKNLQQMLIEQRELKEQLDWFGLEVNKTTNNKSQKDYYSDVLKILQDTHKEYKDLTKTLNHVDAKQLALDKHTRAFAEAVKNIPSLAKFKLEDFAFDKEDGAIEMLEKLKSLIPTTAKNYKSLMVDIEQAIGDIRGEAIIEAKVKADEDLANEIEEMFDGYELSLELDKLGLPKNFMSDLFHIDVFNLDQIRDKIEGEINKIESGKGEKDNLKKLQDFLKKVDDMEEKQMQERLKKYSKYLLKSQSEAVKIKLEELRQLEEIESLRDVSNAQKSVMKQSVRDESQKKLDKTTWDSFKDSDTYIRLFKDLESQSTRSLNRMREELKKYRNSLKELDDPTALKEISERIESLDEQIAKRNPFKGLSEGYKNFREVIKKYGSRSKLEDSLAINRDKEQTLIKRVDDQQIKVATERKALNDALLKGNILEISARKQSLASEEETLDVMLKQLDAQKAITKEQADDFKKQQEAKKEFEDSLSGLGNKIAEYTSALPEIMNDLEAMGVSVDESLKDAAESAAEIGEGVNSIMQGFASNNPLAVIQGITKTGAAISRIFDKSEERRIQRRIKKIEDLSRAYENLQKRIENAYSIGEFRSSYDESYQNIDKQIQAYEDMIAAEEDKKKTDKERIKEWKQAQEDLEQQKKELQDQQLQELGGFGESGVKDAAQQFVDAWMDAFQETGDGLSGLEGKWDEYIKNVIRKQMALKVSDHFIKNITDEVDKALKDDSNLSAEELAKINQMADEALPALSEALQKIANEYGGSALSSSVGELSGLTQGIQGITEQTADQLAGLVNSIRLLVADNYKELVNIANALGTSTQVENPMVGQLKIIASHTNNINSLLESVVTSSTSGRGIRVITQV